MKKIKMQIISFFTHKMSILAAPYIIHFWITTVHLCTILVIGIIGFSWRPSKVSLKLVWTSLHPISFWKDICQSNVEIGKICKIWSICLQEECFHSKVVYSLIIWIDKYDTINTNFWCIDKIIYVFFFQKYFSKVNLLRALARPATVWYS